MILDKALAKQRKTIGLFKVENDGFNLGSQRRPIDKNDLPQVQAELGEYLRRLRNRESLEDFEPTLGLIVSKEKIEKTGEYGLSGEGYRKERIDSTTFPLVELGELCDLVRGVVYSKSDEVSEGGVKVLRANNIDKDRHELNLEDIKLIAPKKDFSTAKRLKKNDIFICLASGSKAHIGKVAFIDHDTEFYFGGFMGAVRVKSTRLLPEFLFKQLITGRFNEFLREQITGANINNLGAKLLARFKIPLPPLDVQKEIVAEIEGYQKVIDGARAVLDNYRPHITIDPEWPMVELREAAKLINGRAYKREELLTQGRTPVLRVGNLFSNKNWYYSDLELPEEKYCNEGDLLYAWSASFGPRIWDGPRAIFHYHIWKIETSEVIEKRFLFHLLEADSKRIKSEGHGIAMMHATKREMERRKFPLPPLETQQGIIAEIEAEQKLVNANRELIERMEKKIQAVLARVWEEES